MGKPADCIPGVAFSYNVWPSGTCGITDKTGPPFYVNSSDGADGNYHITGGVAVGLVTSTSPDALLTVDKDEDGRSNPWDAGADEIGGTLPPPPTDTDSPSTPQGLTVVPFKTSLLMSWNASTDNVGVVGYGVFKASTKTSTVLTLSHTFSGLTCDTNYAIGVTAVDAAGNESSLAEATANITTLPCDSIPTYDMNVQYDRLESSSVHKRYVRDSAIEASKVETYWRSGGTKPVIASIYGKFLVDTAEELRK